MLQYGAASKISFWHRLRRSDEDFAKELDRLIFFAGNGCGDYYCYYADADGAIDDGVIYIWEHEESCLKKAASNIEELIVRYYHDEI